MSNQWYDASTHKPPFAYNLDDKGRRQSVMVQVVNRSGMQGVACWRDVFYYKGSQQTWEGTGVNYAITHWKYLDALPVDHPSLKENNNA